MTDKEPREPSPALILGRLADEQRLRVLSAVALGGSSVVEAASRAGVSEDEAARALAHLVGAGMIRQGESGLEVDLGAFARAARAASTPRKRPDLGDASPEQAAVLRSFVDGDGRITALPAREAKRRVVLEYVAERFEPGREYGEREVSGLVLSVHSTIPPRCGGTWWTRGSSSGKPASTGAPRPDSTGASYTGAAGR